MSLLIFILTCWGFTHIMVVGRILDTPRNWIIIKSEFLGEMITCHQCCSFWVGMLVYLFMEESLPDLFYSQFDIFFWGLLSSGVVTLLKNLNNFLFSSK